MCKYLLYCTYIKKYRYKIDRERLRIVSEMGKPKNLYVQLMDMN